MTWVKDEKSRSHHVVIVGGGFAGLYAAQSLPKSGVRVTLIDRNNYHLFQPLLYQVATGGLSPADIATPLRSLFRRRKHVRVLQGEVTGFDVEQREVLLGESRVPYDTLIIATGATHHYFGNDDWEQVAPGLKTVEQALDIRRRIFSAFEHAEMEADPAIRQQWMTFAIIGGGPTGVELAGAVGELAQHTLRGDFRAIDTSAARVVLIEAGDQILSDYSPALAEQAVHSLSKLGVTVSTNAKVTDLKCDKVTIETQQGADTIPSKTVLWAAGVSASPLGRELVKATGAGCDQQGRILVQDNLSVPNHPNILVLGDLAHVRDVNGTPLPGVAPVAIQQGSFAAKLIRRRLKGKRSRPFRYVDKGSMAVIGRSAAVAEVGPFQIHGLPAWLAWLFVHLIYLVEYENRLLVFIQWAWNYFTRNRSARLITQPVSANATNAGTRKQPAKLGEGHSDQVEGSIDTDEHNTFRVAKSRALWANPFGRAMEPKWETDISRTRTSFPQ